jgi:acyl-coenzyme A thioesterase PaaI-like protein
MDIPDSGPQRTTAAADAQGFTVWASDSDDFNAIYGPVRIRIEGAKVRCRVETGQRRSNTLGGVHGGFMLAFLDQVLFLAPATLGLIEIGRAVTLSQSSQFLAQGRLDEPLDAVVEVVAETGRLLFQRGLMMQGDRMLLSFEATLRKLGPKKA